MVYLSFFFLLEIESVIYCKSLQIPPTPEQTTTWPRPQAVMSCTHILIVVVFKKHQCGVILLLIKEVRRTHFV